MAAFATECTIPVNTFPSHFRSTVMALRSFGFGPQFPLHEPLNGSASRSATEGIGISSNVLACILELLSDVKSLVPTSFRKIDRGIIASELEFPFKNIDRRRQSTSNWTCAEGRWIRA